MSNELELWRFASSRLAVSKAVVLLIVAESSGSSPGRAGYKMAVAADGELCGSVGGGVMEVNLVEQARKLLSEPGAIATGIHTILIDQVHKKNSPQASGMICSGRQAVIQTLLTKDDLPAIDHILSGVSVEIEITLSSFAAAAAEDDTARLSFERAENGNCRYTERLGPRDKLIIIGGGHCALALSELASHLDFRISIFDDRPDLNTIAKNEFADGVTIIESYDAIARHVPSDGDAYVVVMTLGYASDKVVIKHLIGQDFKYIGVLGSMAKMATLMKELRAEGLDQERLNSIRTPIGLAINSRTPEEIAVSIAAELISIRNASVDG